MNCNVLKKVLCSRVRFSAVDIAVQIQEMRKSTQQGKLGEVVQVMAIDAGGTGFVSQARPVVLMFRSCVVQALSRGDGTATCSTLPRNIASRIKILPTITLNSR